MATKTATPSCYHPSSRFSLDTVRFSLTLCKPGQMFASHNYVGNKDVALAFSKDIYNLIHEDQRNIIQGANYTDLNNGTFCSSVIKSFSFQGKDIYRANCTADDFAHLKEVADYCACQQVASELCKGYSITPSITPNPICYMGTSAITGAVGVNIQGVSTQINNVLVETFGTSNATIISVENAGSFSVLIFKNAYYSGTTLLSDLTTKYSSDLGTIIGFQESPALKIAKINNEKVLLAGDASANAVYVIKNPTSVSDTKSVFSQWPITNNSFKIQDGVCSFSGWQILHFGQALAVIPGSTTDSIVVMHDSKTPSPAKEVKASIFSSSNFPSNSNTVALCDGKHLYVEPGSFLDTFFPTAIAAASTATHTYITIGSYTSGTKAGGAVIGVIDAGSDINLAMVGQAGGNPGFIITGDDGEGFGDSLDMATQNSGTSPSIVITCRTSNVAYVLTSFPTHSPITSKQTASTFPSSSYIIEGTSTTRFSTVKIGKFDGQDAIVLASPNNYFPPYTNGGIITVLTNPTPINGKVSPFSDSTMGDSKIYHIYGSTNDLKIGSTLTFDTLDKDAIGFGSGDGQNFWRANSCSCGSKPVPVTKLNILGLGATEQPVITFFDIDKNGKDDLIVGRPSLDRVDVIYGPLNSASVDITTPSLTITSNGGSAFGCLLQTGLINPLNLGGASSLIVGACTKSSTCGGGATCKGAVHIIYQSSSYTQNAINVTDTLGFTILGPISATPEQIFPASISVGNINEDTVFSVNMGGNITNNDLVITAFFGPNNHTTYVVLGQNFTVNATYEVLSLTSSGTSGFAIASGTSAIISDVTGDAKPDLVLGEANYTDTSTNQGAIFVIKGPIAFDSFCTWCAVGGDGCSGDPTYCDANNITLPELCVFDSNCKSDCIPQNTLDLDCPGNTCSNNKNDPDCGSITLPLNHTSNGINIYGNQEQMHLGGTLSVGDLQGMNYLIAESFCPMCNYYTGSSSLPSNGTIYLIAPLSPPPTEVNNSISTITQACQVVSNSQQLAEAHAYIADVNAQGGPDLVVGIPSEPASTHKGAVYILHDVPSLNPCPDINQSPTILYGSQNNQEICRSMAIGGLSGMGKHDIACAGSPNITIFYEPN